MTPMSKCHGPTVRLIPAQAASHGAGSCAGGTPVGVPYLSCQPTCRGPLLRLVKDIVRNLTVPVCGLSLARKKGATLARKKGATATKDARYATKYLDTTGTLGISIPDFDS